MSSDATLPDGNQGFAKYEGTNVLVLKAEA